MIVRILKTVGMALAGMAVLVVGISLVVLSLLWLSRTTDQPTTIKSPMRRGACAERFFAIR
jgi:hypothetical protein